MITTKQSKVPQRILCHLCATFVPFVVVFFAFNPRSTAASSFFRPMKLLQLRRLLFMLAVQPVFIRGADKAGKQRMRLQGLRLEFRMKLAPDEMRMAGDLHHLHVSAVGRRARETQPAA